MSTMQAWHLSEPTRSVTRRDTDPYSLLPGTRYTFFALAAIVAGAVLAFVT